MLVPRLPCTKGMLVKKFRFLGPISEIIKIFFGGIQEYNSKQAAQGILNHATVLEPFKDSKRNLLR